MRYTRISVPYESSITGGLVHAYLLHGALPTLVDAPPGGPAMVAEIESALAAAGDGPLQQVLVTHAHPDHVDGAAVVHARWPTATFRKRAPLPEDDGIAWQAIEKEPVIAAGNGQLWALATPGHAPDHSCFFEVQAGMLLGGDLAINGSTVVIHADGGGSLRAYLTSLRTVLELQPRVILPSHGDPILQPSALLRGYVSHRMTREQQILECLAAGLDTSPAIVDRLYARIADELKPAARQNVLAHLRKLEEDARVSSDGDRWHLRSA